jgi:hypothetical protein
MTCSILQMQTGPVFICGDRPRKRFCRFCGARATAVCDWPKVRREEIRLDQVQLGDRVYPFREANDAYAVVYIQTRPAEGEVWLRLECRGHVTQYVLEPWKPVFRPLAGTCDAPVCRRHLRHVGPNRDYCQRHWKAWERVV